MVGECCPAAHGAGIEGMAFDFGPVGVILSEDGSIWRLDVYDVC